MKRFILLTFGFLGWAFYEMSGGSDFESASDRMARLNPAPAVTVADVDSSDDQQEAETAEVVDTDPPNLSSDGSEVTRVSLNLTTLQDALEDTTPSDEGAAEREIADTQVASIDPDTGVAINTTTTSSATTPAIIPSLIAPNDTGAVNPEAAVQPTDGGDVRTVSGNRVNVRGGPGTDFGVVFKLVEGDAVEVLEDNGDGWVRMRPLDGGGEGWMADWLLSAG